MNSDDQPRDPFADFINASLDLNGIEGLDQAAVAEKMRHILRNLPANVTPDLWNEQLDPLQAVIRICLDVNTVLGAFEEPSDAANFSRDDLEILVMLSVTFAFVSQNQLRPAFDESERHGNDDTLLARRLRDTLQVTLGWVKRAAHDGDPVAGRLVGEIHGLLNASKHLE